MAIFTSTIWIEGFETLGSTTTCFSIGFTLLFLNILHTIVVTTFYDLMFSVTTNMIRIPHMPLYFNLLNSNLKDYNNMVFLSFDYIGFNIMICPMTICIVFFYFLWDCLRFLNIVLLICGTNKLLTASTSEIPSSQTKATSLCWCKVPLFIPTITTCKCGCNPDLKTIIKKLFVVLC